MNHCLSSILNTTEFYQEHTSIDNQLSRVRKTLCEGSRARIFLAAYYCTTIRQLTNGYRVEDIEEKCNSTTNIDIHYI